jgi:hypothetical protein
MRFLTFMNTPTGRAIRVGGGLLLFAIGFLVGGWLGVAVCAFSVLPIATGVFGVCPVNPLFGQSMRACSVSSKSRPQRA